MKTWLVAMMLVGCASDGMQGLQGAEGPRGPEGKQGVAGPPGADGKDGNTHWRPISLINCSVTLDVISVAEDGSLSLVLDNMRETFLSYSVMIYLNGDVETSCVVGLGSAQEGSDSSYRAAPTVGAHDRSCITSADYPSPNGSSAGYWRFTGAGSMRGEYVDADNPLGLNGRTHVFSESECAAWLMDEDGVWLESTITEALL